MKSSNQARVIPTKKQPQTQAQNGQGRAGEDAFAETLGNLYKRSSRKKLINVMLSFLPIKSAEAVFKDYFESLPRGVCEMLVRRLLKSTLVPPRSTPGVLKRAQAIAADLSHGSGHAHFELEEAVYEAVGLLDLLAVKLETLEGDGPGEVASIGCFNLSHSTQKKLVAVYKAVHEEWQNSESQH